MIALLLLAGLCSPGLSVPAPERSEKALFSVVKFPNDACTASTGLTGTCVTSTECTGRDGTATGTCAAGFGVCCVVYSATCIVSTAISTNNTYLRNPGYTAALASSTSTQTCSYKISKADSEVCQLRLDFETLELGQTVATGACTDSLTASTTADNSVSTSYPAICGTSSGHHMYLHLGSSSDSASALVSISVAASSAAAKWNILVRQITCSTTYAAPEGCTMYLTGVTGTWSSYGYVDGVTSTEHPQSQNYQVCIRREEGYCSIRHSTTSSTSFYFSGQDDSASVTTGFRGSTDCYLDFITIPGGSLDGSSGNAATTTAQDRYCGKFLGWSPAATTPQPIVSNVLPFRVGVWTDNDDGEDTPYGVSLDYQQLPC